MSKKNNQNHNLIHKMMRLAFFLAIGIVLSIVESMIPIPIAIPGVRLGLANTMGLIVLYYYSPKEYLSIGFLRVFIVALIRTGLFSTAALLSFSGWLLSSLITLLIYSLRKASIFGLSVTSAMFHCTGQILAYIIYMYLISSSKAALALINYLPILLITGFIGGLLTATIASVVLSKLDKSIFKSDLVKKGQIEERKA